MIKRFYFLLVSMLFCSSSIFAQDVIDWVFPINEVGEISPIDVSSKIKKAIKETDKVFIVGYNTDMRGKEKRINLMSYSERQFNIGNFNPSNVELSFYDYKLDRVEDVWFRFGFGIADQNMHGVRSFYLVITSNEKLNELLQIQSFNLKRVGFNKPGVHIYISEASETQEQFYWNLRQNLLFFSNYNFVPNTIKKQEPPKDKRVKTYLDIQGYKGFEKNGAQSNYLKASAGFGFKCNEAQENCFSFNINLGIQQSNDFWSKGNFQNQVVSVLNPNQQLDELLVTSSNVKENYDLSATSGVFGLDLKYNLGKGKAYIGFYGNLVKPIVYDLNFTNTSGEFDYVGISNAIQEPLTNIPELGLVAGVSYFAYKSDLTGKLKTFFDFGLMSGYSFGEKSPLDINLSVGLITSKKFNLEQSNSTISSSYGDYNSIATVNNTQISVPCFWNIGLGVRKYLN